MQPDTAPQDDDPELDDLAAEPDNADPAVGAQPDDTDNDATLYTGRCHDGPLDGHTTDSRFPAGFLLVDMPHRQCWLYDRHDDGDFYARTTTPQPLLDTGPVNRWRAADEGNYDVRALGGEAA